MPTFICRHYNKIYLSDGFIVKECSPDRVSIETTWFNAAKSFIPNSIPQIFEVDESGKYSMEYIAGDNAFNWIRKQTNKEIILQKVQRIIEYYLENIHRNPIKANISDICQMYFEKPKKAIEFFSERKDGQFETYFINGNEVLHPLSILDSVYQGLRHHLEDIEYYFMHGDATLGNTLISEAGEIYFIDPRGGFGNTKLYGDPRYDFGKLFFSMIGGFDALNVGNYVVKRCGGNRFVYKIEDLPFKEDLESLFFIETGLNRILLQYIHATIWLSLAPHLDNEDQMLTAFLHGTKFLNEVYQNLSKDELGEDKLEKSNAS